VDAISREVSVPIYRLEEWRERALAGIDAGLKERKLATKNRLIT
jgi:transposase